MGIELLLLMLGLFLRLLLIRLRILRFGKSILLLGVNFELVLLFKILLSLIWKMRLLLHFRLGFDCQLNRLILLSGLNLIVNRSKLLLILLTLLSILFFKIGILFYWSFKEVEKVIFGLISNFLRLRIGLKFLFLNELLRLILNQILLNLLLIIIIRVV